MKSSDMELFSSALSEAMEKRLVDELSACRESDRCSSWHKKRMRRIVRGKTVEPRTRAENIDKYLLYRYNWRRFAWYLVAAVILLVMVTRVWEPQPLLTPEPWSSFLKNCERMLPLLLLIPISFLLANDYEIELGLVCGVRNAKLMLAKFVPIVCYTLLGMATVILLYRYIPFDEMNLTNFQEVIELLVPSTYRLYMLVSGVVTLVFFAALFLFIRVVCRNVYLPVGIGMFLCAVFDSFNSSIGLGQTDIRFSLFDPFISTYFLGNAAPQQYALGDVWTYNRLLFFTLAILLLAASYAILRRDGLHQHGEVPY